MCSTVHFHNPIKPTVQSSIRRTFLKRLTLLDSRWHAWRIATTETKTDVAQAATKIYHQKRQYPSRYVLGTSTYNDPTPHGLKQSNNISPFGFGVLARNIDVKPYLDSNDGNGGSELRKLYKVIRPWRISRALLFEKTHLGRVLNVVARWSCDQSVDRSMAARGGRCMK